MRAEGQAHIERIEKALALVRKFLDWDRALRRLDELNARVEDPKLWDNPKDAEAVMKERRQLESAIGTVRDIGSQMADAIEYIDLGESEDDEATVEEGLATLASLADRADRDKVQALLGGEADGNDTFIEIHAGAGGTESQDWAEMLLRMYSRWAEKRGYKVEVIEYQSGEQAGIKSATILCKGENAYGYAKTESGVHRLVRISPYDSSARRHTRHRQCRNRHTRNRPSADRLEHRVDATRRYRIALTVGHDDSGHDAASCQRGDEGLHPAVDDQHPVEHAQPRAKSQRRDERHPDRDACAQQQHRAEPDQLHDGADGQIDAADDQHQRHADCHNRQVRSLPAEIEQVVSSQKELCEQRRQHKGGCDKQHEHVL